MITGFVLVQLVQVLGKGVQRYVDGALHMPLREFLGCTYVRDDSALRKHLLQVHLGTNPEERA